MFKLTVSDMITMVYDMTVGLPEGQTVPGYQFQKILKYMNMLLHSFQGYEAFPWKIENTQVQFTSISSVVNLPGEETYYTCIKAHTAAALNKPGTGADWALYWVEFGDSTNSSDWVTGTSYTTNMEYTLSNLNNLIIGVNSARLLTDGAYESVEVISRDDFEANYSEFDEGQIKRVWMEKSNNMNDVSPILHIHPNTDNTDDILHLTVITMEDEISSPSEVISLQQQWLRAFIWSLCSDCSDVFEVSDRWGRKAGRMLSDAILASQDRITGRVMKGAYE